MSINRLEKVWPQWKIGDMIGEGSFGKVYKAVREEHGLTTFAAIKAISIPQNNAELASLRSEGWSEGATQTYLQGIVDDFINEIKMLESMKGTQNIVGVEDYQVLEKEDEVGWDIFIRMELLTSLVEHTSDKKLSEDEVIKLGFDLLGALEICAKKSVIHRDIKPENIFVSEHGHYKLGDFGIARELEKTAGSMSQKGTYNYIAPEVVSGRRYDATVDTYSLGVVLYKLLNNNRLPFTDHTAEVVQYQDRKNALDKRLKGEQMAAPIGANHSLAQVVLKACAFNPHDRYQTPEEFKRALEMVKAGQTVPDFLPSAIDFDSSATVSAIPTSTTGKQILAEPSTSALPVGHFGKSQKSKKPLMIVACIAVLAIIGVGAFFAWNTIGPGNPVNQIVAAFAEQNPNEAIALFDENRHDMDMDAFENALSQRLNDLREEFRNEAIGYNMAMMEINTIRNWRLWRLDNQVEETEQFIDSLNDSRVAFQVAETHYERGDFLGAIDNFRLVSVDDNNYNEARNGLNRAIEGYRINALDRAATYAERGNYRQAIIILDNALEVAGNEAELAGQRESYVRRDVSTRIDAAQALASADNFNGAMNDLRLLEAEHPGNTEVARAITAVENNHVTFIVGRANGFVAENRFTDAARELNEGLRLHPNNVTLTTTRNNIEATHVADIISQANEHVANERFESAITLLNDGLRTYPNNATLTSALNETQTHEIDLLLAQADALVANRQHTQAINLLQNSRLANNSRVVSRVTEINAMLPVPLRHSAPFFDRNPNVGHEQWTGIWFYDTGNMGGRQVDNPLNFRTTVRDATTQFTLHNLNRACSH